MRRYSFVNSSRVMERGEGGGMVKACMRLEGRLG